MTQITWIVGMQFEHNNYVTIIIGDIDKFLLYNIPSSSIIGSTCVWELLLTPLDSLVPNEHYF